MILLLLLFVYSNFVSWFWVQGCVALEELYLSHNGIAKMEGLSSLVNLRVLDVSSNKITSVDDIVNLTKYAYFSVSGSTDNLLYVLTLVDSLPRLIYCRLEDLWLNDNQIASLEGIAEAVSGSKEKLTTIYLKNNPCVWLLALQICFSPLKPLYLKIWLFVSNIPWISFPFCWIFFLVRSWIVGIKCG